MPTKPCKSCREPIDADAKKCPRCQTFQNWFRNPQWLSLIWILLMIVFYWSVIPRFRQTDFTQYKSGVTASIKRVDVPEDKSKGVLVTIEIVNTTDKKWGRPKFTVQSLDDAGNVLSAENLSDYNAIVQPKSSTLLTTITHLLPSAPVASRTVTITDADNNSF